MFHSVPKFNLGEDDFGAWIRVYCRQMGNNSNSNNSISGGDALDNVDDDYLLEHPASDSSVSDTEGDIGQNEDQEQDDEAIEALAPLPENEYTSLQEAEKAIHQFTVSHGYAVAKTP